MQDLSELGGAGAPRRVFSRLALAVIFASLCILAASPVAFAGQWVGTWTTSPVNNPFPIGNPRAQPPLEGVFLGAQARDQSLRQIVHTTIGGEALRVKLSNAHGTQPVTFGNAYVGLQRDAATLVGGSNRRLTFRGRPSVTIAPGAEAVSDRVRMTVPMQADLAISLHVRGASGPMSWHPGAFSHSYISDPGVGDRTAETGERSFPHATTSWFWLKGVDVVAPRGTGAIVAFGDSITDGAVSTLNENDRWPDLLFRRLLAGPPAGRKPVLNAGIGGNTITRIPCDVCGLAAVDRLGRDVLSQAGVTHVILFEGTNDIRRGASAEQIIAGMREVTARMKARKLKVIGATITPRADTGWMPATMNPIRRQVNEFVRSGGLFDGVIDFDALTRDPANPDQLRPAFDVNSTLGGPGDHLHPGRAGFVAMAYGIDRSLFR